MKRMVLVAALLASACGGATSNVPDSRPMGPLGVNEASGDFCGVVQRFAAAAKESPPYASTRGEQMLDFMWHTKDKPAGASACTVTAPTQEAGPATLLCSYDPGGDANGRFAELAKDVGACLKTGDWQTSPDDNKDAAAWFSPSQQSKVSVYSEPEASGAMHVVVDFDPLPPAAGGGT